MMLKTKNMKINTIDLLNEKFNLNKGKKTSSRIDSEHPVNFFVGYNQDGKANLIINEDGNVETIKSTKYIEVKFTENINGKKFLSFILLDDSKLSMFLRFCDDLISSTRNIKKEEILSFIIKRWDSWRNVFKNTRNDILSEKEIMGLIGELTFLDKLIDEFGVELAVESWTGCENSSKDFELSNIWYEIKTKMRYSQKITISSIEQLDSEIEGILIVNDLERTNSINNLGLNLNKLVCKIREKINIYDILINFEMKLNKVGYIENELYNEYNYKILKTRGYTVNENFPRMKESDLKKYIIEMKYSILIEGIKEFVCKGRENEWISKNINVN